MTTPLSGQGNGCLHDHPANRSFDCRAHVHGKCQWQTNVVLACNGAETINGDATFTL